MVLLSFFFKKNNIPKIATAVNRLCCKKKKKKLTARNGNDVEIFFLWDLKCRVNIILCLANESNK